MGRVCAAKPSRASVPRRCGDPSRDVALRYRVCVALPCFCSGLFEQSWPFLLFAFLFSHRSPFVGEYCSVVILGCGVGVLQNSRIKCFFFENYAGNRPRKQKNRPKRPRLGEIRRKLGQIDEKNASNPKKALPRRENGARIEFFESLGQNVKNHPASPEN